MVAASVVAVTGARNAQHRANDEERHFITDAAISWNNQPALAIAWGVTPVGAKDCAPFAGGEVCATVSRWSFASSSGGFGTQPFVDGHVRATFVISNGSDTPLSLAAFGAHSFVSVGYGTRHATGYDASSLPLLTNSDTSPSCARPSNGGVVTVGAQGSLTLCTSVTSVPFITNSGNSPLSQHYVSMFLGGVFAWATGVATDSSGMPPLAASASTWPGRTYQHLTATDSLGNLPLGVSTSTSQPVISADVSAENIDGGSLGYVEARVPATVSQRTLCRATMTSPCPGRVSFVPSSGPIVMRYLIHNGLAHPVGIHATGQFVDVQFGCTANGCSSGRYVVTPSSHRHVKGCSVSSTAAIAANGNVTICEVFETPPGSVLSTAGMYFATSGGGLADGNPYFFDYPTGNY